MKPLGKTLRLFLVDGTPNGIVIAEIINWSEQVVRVPRALLSQFLERKESNRTGAYLLIGDDDEVPGRLRVYVGESDNLGARLRQHANKQDLFDWDFACVVTSKDQNLTKAHGLFLESQIIQQAMSADRVSLDNTQMHIYESIPESDISDMTYFFDQISVLLPALGIELFSPANLQQPGSSAQIRPSDQIIDDVTQSKFIERRESLQPITGSTPIDVILRDNKFGIDARGLESNGEILVLEGSRARGVNESEVNVYRQLRERLIKEGKIASTGDPRVLEFKSDVLFNSPSAASAVILDRNDNGRSTWKEINTNKSLNDWYADQANLVEQPKGESGPS
jgi:hypothetical protein